MKKKKINTMKKILLFVCFAFLVFAFLLKHNQIFRLPFLLARLLLQVQDTVYMYSGVATGFPGNFNQYITGELAQPGTGLWKND